jgi:hypothetical protein
MSADAKSVDDELREINEQIQSIKSELSQFKSAATSENLNREISTIRFGMYLTVGSVFLITLLAVNIAIKILCGRRRKETETMQIAENDHYNDDKNIFKPTQEYELVNIEPSVYDDLKNDENIYDEIQCIETAPRVTTMVGNATYDHPKFTKTP